MSPSREPNYLFIGMMSFFIGHVLFACLMYALAAMFATVSSSEYLPWYPIVVVGYIGLTQLVSVIPAIVWLKQKRKFVTMDGVIVGAVVTAFVNGACYLLFVGVPQLL